MISYSWSTTCSSGQHGTRDFLLGLSLTGFARLSPSYWNQGPSWTAFASMLACWKPLSTDDPRSFRAGGIFSDYVKLLTIFGSSSTIWNRILWKSYSWIHFQPKISLESKGVKFNVLFDFSRSIYYLVWWSQLENQEQSHNLVGLSSSNCG